MNVEVVQRRLWEQSKQHRSLRESSTPLFPVDPYEGRVRGLMDLMHQPQWIAAACDRVLVRSRGKAAGVDRVTVSEFQQNRRANLEALRLELKRGTYQPQPLRRVMIPKANGKQRSLGVPCLRDKIVQEAIRMALEPIYEAEFHDDSYGFRPNRSTHHAVLRCQQMMQKRFTWVIEGDVKACFDEISHKAILGGLREKVMDNKFLALITRLLKSGVSIDGVVHPTEKGVPQGGVVSPLLSNVVLNKLDWFLHRQGRHGLDSGYAWKAGRPNVRFVRYADDWCVFITRASKQYAERLRDQIGDLLTRQCGVELSLEKTRITHVRDGFNFLGFRLQLGVGQTGKYVPKVRVPRSALTQGVRRLNEAMRWQPTQQSGAARLVRGSAVVTGWANYYRIAHDFNRAANTLDFHAYWIGVKALCRRYDISAAQCIRKYGRGDNLNIGGSYTLKRAQDIQMSWKQESPKSYNPGTGCYLDDVDWEAEIRQYENRQRPGRMDFKAMTLFRDGHRCRQCGSRVTIETSETDHIKPVNSFANFAQANHLFNLQTLCLRCHKLKHGAKSSRHSGKPDAGKACTSGLGLGPG
jgi:RNA-directed DNA polymerase